MTILNMFASVTSADSVTEHIEEPREVPESSMSSIFSTRTMPCHPQAVHA